MKKQDWQIDICNKIGNNREKRSQEKRGEQNALFSLGAVIANH